jgi:predicted MFS family arabinose efflux permease
MALIAVTWLALELVPSSERGTWVAVALASYTLPSAIGVLLLGRFLGGRSGAQLGGWDATLRAVMLAVIPVLYVPGMLTITWYVVLLAFSSLLHSWGSAGRYSLIAELLPVEHRLPANAILTTIAEFATIVGPPLASLLIVWTNAATVIAVDAATFAALAVTYRLVLPRTGWREAARTDGDEKAAGLTVSRSSGFSVIRHDRTMVGLISLSFAFFFLYGPVLVALPIYVTEDIHGSVTLLSAYYTSFGIGAVIGGLATGYLRNWMSWPIILAIVLVFGLAQLPLGLGAPVGFGIAAHALAGFAWGPYAGITAALFQRSTSAALLPEVMAVNGAATVLSVPLGTILGGPLVAAVGARGTLLVTALGILILGVLSAGIGLYAVARRRTLAASAPCT